MRRLPKLSSDEIAEIAHELRSPLGGFDSMLALLARTPLSTEQARLVEALAASAAHLRAILGRVLPAHPDEAAADLSFSGLMAAIALSAAARAAMRGLRFECRIDPALQRNADVEVVALRQVLENLIDNAIRATPAGGIVLDVRPGEAGRISFSLGDQGPGIEAERAERLMQAGGEGGFGLPIASRLVSERGGKLRAEPGGPEGGTIFRFDWPAQSRCLASGGARVLVVDDHPASRQVLRTVLAAVGFAVTEAGGVAEARACLRNGTFAAILTDLNMPEGGGAAILNEIAAWPAAQRPATIVVSADDPRADPALAALVDEVVLKPLAVPALMRALSAVGLHPVAARAA